MVDSKPPDDPCGVVDALQEENAALKAELRRMQDVEAAAAERRRRVIKSTGRIALPLLDRKRVVRSFLDLYETSAAYLGPQEGWPPRDEVVLKARLFAMACLRFFIRRRMFMVFFSLLALGVPGAQVYLAFQQNAIIANQNKYFNIQVYDIVAQSLTSRDATAKQITTALLAREDFSLLNGMIHSVFAVDSGGAFTQREAAAGRPLLLNETAARGYLLSAFGQAIDYHGARFIPEELYQAVEPTFRVTLRDAASRLPQLLRISSEVALKDAAVGQDCYRYVFNLSTLLRKVWSVATATDRREEFFAMVAPLVARVSRTRVWGSVDRPYVTVYGSAMHELLLDLELEPKIGEPPPQLYKDPGEVEAMLRSGFEKLKQGIGSAHRVDWDNLKRMAEVP